jgi:hypothetical protein
VKNVQASLGQFFERNRLVKSDFSYTECISRYGGNEVFCLILLITIARLFLKMSKNSKGIVLRYLRIYFNYVNRFFLSVINFEILHKLHYF